MTRQLTKFLKQKFGKRLHFLYRFIISLFRHFSITFFILIEKNNTLNCNSSKVLSDMFYILSLSCYIFLLEKYQKNNKNSLSKDKEFSWSFYCQ